MARIIIKESAIRNYVRSLIRESLEMEGLKPEDEKKHYENFVNYINNGGKLHKRTIDSWGYTFPELTKMINGQAYNRSGWNTVGNSNFPYAVERYYRRMMGYPSFGTKGENGVIPSQIDGNGNDITPENSDEGRAKLGMQRKQNHAMKMANTNIRQCDQEFFNAMHDVGDDQNVTKDKFANNVEEDPYTQMMLAMTPEEREEYNDRKRRERIEMGRAKNAELTRQAQELSGRGLSFPTKKELIQRIAYLKQKQAETGEKGEANTEWDTYEYLIKDVQKILNKYYGGHTRPKNDTTDKDMQQALDDDLDDLFDEEDDEASVLRQDQEHMDDFFNDDDYKFSS